MARHQTPRTLNDNLRLGRLTLPQWVALVVGGLSLWVFGSLAAGIRDPNLHIMAATLPTVGVVAPILALWRGGIERYPHQLARYAMRRGVVYTRRGVVQLHNLALRGITYAALRLRRA